MARVLPTRLMLAWGCRVTESTSTPSGVGTFFDGVTGARHDVTIDLAPIALRVLSTSGAVLAEWPYSEIERVSTVTDALRLGRKGSDVLARLEIRDPTLIAEISRHASGVDPGAVTERREAVHVVAWSLAAAVSLVLLGVFGVPLLAGRMTPFVPLSLERRLGDAIDAEMRPMLIDPRSKSKFECGGIESERAGRAALDQLVARLESAAALPQPLHVAVVRRSDANAIALPGGHIYVFKGLITEAKTSDELAGVIAHEIGHVSHRDSTRSALESAGLSLLFGMLLGDFTGGSAVVIATKMVLQSSYSREVEAAADAYSVSLMRSVGGNPHALGSILVRIGGATEPAMKILLDHPETKARVTAIDALAGPPSGTPLLDDKQWAAVKAICSGP